MDGAGSEELVEDVREGRLLAVLLVNCDCNGAWNGVITVADALVTKLLDEGVELFPVDSLAVYRSLALTGQYRARGEV